MFDFKKHCEERIRWAREILADVGYLKAHDRKTLERGSGSSKRPCG